MRMLTIAIFVALVLAAATVEVLARTRLRAFATLGDVLDEVSDSRITRVGIAAAWWWFGWHFLFAETVQLEL